MKKKTAKLGNVHVSNQVSDFQKTIFDVGKILTVAAGDSINWGGMDGKTNPLCHMIEHL